MTDKEIIKALECCMNGRCDDECPFRETREHCHNLDSLILDLINRQQAEIERLTVNMNAFGLGMKREKERVDTARAEAIKEFAERLCEGRVSNDPVVIAVRCAEKEMTGEAKPEKCDCFCEEQRIKGWLDGNTPITEPITVCNGTRERDECTCGGDKSKCDFYAKDYSYGY